MVQIILLRSIAQLMIFLHFYEPGFNVETIEYKNITFTVWDVGGQDKVKG